MDPLVFAEDALAYFPPSDSAEFLVTDNVVLSHGRHNPNRWAAYAARVRFSADYVERQIDDVQDWFALRGRREFVWFLGPSATPMNIVDRLLSRGAFRDPEEGSFCTPMVLDHEPPPGPAGVEVRRVTTFKDYVRAREISMGEIPEQGREAIRDSLPASWAHARKDESRSDFLALLDGEPAACGTSCD